MRLFKEKLTFFFYYACDLFEVRGTFSFYNYRINWPWVALL